MCCVLCYDVIAACCAMMYAHAFRCSSNSSFLEFVVSCVHPILLLQCVLVLCVSKLYRAQKDPLQAEIFNLFGQFGQLRTSGLTNVCIPCLCGCVVGHAPDASQHQLGHAAHWILRCPACAPTGQHRHAIQNAHYFTDAGGWTSLGHMLSPLDETESRSL